MLRYAWGGEASEVCRRPPRPVFSYPALVHQKTALYDHRVIDILNISDITAADVGGAQRPVPSLRYRYPKRSEYRRWVGQR